MTPSNWYRDFMRERGVEVASHRIEKSKPGPLSTLAHYRHKHGIRTFTVYCLNGVHRAIVTFDDLPDDTILKRCGLIGADVRPNWRSGPR